MKTNDNLNFLSFFQFEQNLKTFYPKKLSYQTLCFTYL